MRKIFLNTLLTLGLVFIWLTFVEAFDATFERAKYLAYKYGEGEGGIIKPRSYNFMKEYPPKSKQFYFVSFTKIKGGEIVSAGKMDLHSKIVEDICAQKHLQYGFVLYEISRYEKIKGKTKKISGRALDAGEARIRATPILEILSRFVKERIHIPVPQETHEGDEDD